MASRKGQQDEPADPQSGLERGVPRRHYPSTPRGTKRLCGRLSRAGEALWTRPGDTHTSLTLQPLFLRVRCPYVQVDGGCDVDKQDVDHRTPLYLAVEANRDEVVKFLTQQVTCHANTNPCTPHARQCASAPVRQCVSAPVRQCASAPVRQCAGCRPPAASSRLTADMPTRAPPGASPTTLPHPTLSLTHRTGQREHHPLQDAQERRRRGRHRAARISPAQVRTSTAVLHACWRVSRCRVSTFAHPYHVCDPAPAPGLSLACPCPCPCLRPSTCPHPWPPSHCPRLTAPAPTPSRACEKGFLDCVKELVKGNADINLVVSDGYLLFGDTPLHRWVGSGVG